MDNFETSAGQTGCLFVPLFQQMRRHLRRDFINGEPATWIPVECSLLVCYEFAACSLQTRYVFVAVLLLCGMRGSDEIPFDTRFLAKTLSADERTIKKSVRELLAAGLLAERKKERKTEKTHTAQKERESENEGVSVDSENFPENGNGHRSQFSLEDCLAYVKICETKGEPVKNAKGLASHLYKTGEADAFILAALYPEDNRKKELEIYGEPRKFLDEPCQVCYGSKMEVVSGRGARPCPHCKNERGQSTGKQPEGEI